jgi:glycosyltransferase A (GT-A) superfamily protein (DUF2064 family)
MKTQFSIDIATESKIALMVYGKTPCIQAKQKQLFGSKNGKKSYQLFEQLNQHTQVICEKSNIDCIWIYDHEVPGNTFGTRYSNAFKSIFEQGYDFVISIGNDIPGLNESHIQIAATQSANHQSVLGPTQDGGDYLIAIHRESFDPASFANLPWNTNQLHDALNAYLKVAEQEVFQLEELIDIDDFKSFSRSARQTTSCFFQKLFIRILLSIRVYIISKIPFFNPTLTHQDHPLRAPPAFI